MTWSPHLETDLQSSCWFLTSCRTFALPLCFVLCILNQIGFKSHFFLTGILQTAPHQQHLNNNKGNSFVTAFALPSLAFSFSWPIYQNWKKHEKAARKLWTLNSIQKFLGACCTSCNPAWYELISVPTLSLFGISLLPRLKPSAKLTSALHFWHLIPWYP